MSELSKYLELQQPQPCIFAGCDDKSAFCLYVSLWSLLKHSLELAQKVFFQLSLDFFTKSLKFGLFVIKKSLK